MRKKGTMNTVSRLRGAPGKTSSKGPVQRGTSTTELVEDFIVQISASEAGKPLAHIHGPDLRATRS